MNREHRKPRLEFKFDERSLVHVSELAGEERKQAEQLRTLLSQSAPSPSTPAFPQCTACTDPTDLVCVYCRKPVCKLCTLRCVEKDCKAAMHEECREACECGTILCDTHREQCMERHDDEWVERMDGEDEDDFDDDEEE